MKGPAGCQLTNAAFLLAQLGAHAARRFAERIEPLGIAPPHAGILCLIAAAPGSSQRDLAQHLGVQPSRMVALLDELSEKGLIERRRSLTDRRHHQLGLTKRGERVREEMRALVARHEEDLLAALTPEERASLAALLQKVAGQQGLTPGVHPGYRTL